VDLALLHGGTHKDEIFLSDPRNPGDVDTLDLRVSTRAWGLVSAKLLSVDECFVRISAPEAGLCFGDSGSPLISHVNG